MIKTMFKAGFNKLLKFSPYIFLLLIFIFIWKLNQITPLWADDYCRLGSSTSLIQAAKKAYSVYFTWTGRFLVMTIDYFVFGNYPNSIIYFNFINAIFFCSLIFIIFYLAFNRRPKGLRDTLYILLIFNLIFIGTKAIGEVALWKTGSVGYLWGLTLELAFLAPFFSYIRSQRRLFQNKYLIWGFYLLAFVASTFLEHLSFAVSVVAFWICFERLVRRKNIPSFLLISTALHILGSFILIMAKGNFVRSTIESILPLHERIINNFNFSIEGFLWILVFFWLIALANREFISSLKKSTIWLVFALAGINILAFSFFRAEMTFILRIAFPFEVFIIIVVATLAGFMPRIAIFEITTFLILFVLAFAHGKTAYKNSLYINEQILQRYNLLETFKANHEDSVVVPRISWGEGNETGRLEYISKYTYISDIGNDTSHWTNTCFANALGFKEVTIEASSSN